VRSRVFLGDYDCLDDLSRGKRARACFKFGGIDDHNLLVLSILRVVHKSNSQQVSRTVGSLKDMSDSKGFAMPVAQADIPRAVVFSCGRI